jgi:hypothetical protein
VRLPRWAGITGLAFVALIFLIAVLDSAHPQPKPAGHSSPAPGITVAVPQGVAAATPHHAATPTLKPRPHMTHSVPPPASSSAPAPPASLASVSPTPVPTRTTQPACYPLTSGGNCYEPGEFCRKADHGRSGISGNGEAITCEDNNGWRWEPA